MPSTQNYLHFILGQLSALEDFSFKSMMNEYILYYQGRIVGGIYDDRLLVKPVPSALAYVSNPAYEVPYPGAKEMLMIQEVDNPDFLCDLFKTMVHKCPAPKKRKKAS